MQNDKLDNSPKWVVITYVGKQTKCITENFKETNINVAYKSKIIEYQQG